MLKIERYNQGEEKVLFLHKHSFGNIFLDARNIEEIAKYNKRDIHLVNLDDNPEFLVQMDYMTHERFEHREKTENVYNEIYDYVLLNDIKLVIVFGTGCFWSFDFIRRLKSRCYVACYFADDPEGAEFTSRHYVFMYDYSFCAGVDYDFLTTVAERYKIWGAKKSKFIPIGLRPVMWKDEDIDHKKKDIDIIYIGANNIQKYFFLAKLKRHFKDRMVIYGKGYDKSTGKIKSFVLKILNKIYGMEGIKPIDQKDIVDVYRRSKIGINKHLSYGISNTRCYELPANEVLQICDNERGGEDVFRSGRDIVYYKNAKDAIKKIEFYLHNDIQRMLIVGHGRLRVKEYTIGKTFKIIFDTIKGDINGTL